MLEADWDTCVAMAREQVKEGSHLIDVCVDYTGADGVADMEQVASRFATQSTVPLMVDSTEAPVVETALSWIGGRAVINSVNLEEGDASGTRLDSFLTLAKEFGAAVVCTCIDEEGQARTADWKVRAATAIHDIAVERYGLRPQDLLFDALALPLSTGMEESQEGRHRDHRGHPADQGGAARGVHHPRSVERRRSDSTRPPGRCSTPCSSMNAWKQAWMPPSCTPPRSCPSPRSTSRPARSASTSSTTAGTTATTRSPSSWPSSRECRPSAGAVQEDRSGWTVERRLEHRIVDGDRNGIEDDLEEAMAAGHTPIIIINDFLLAGMKTVGELFASGEMQLPFVLGSAETMKTAVAYLEPFMEKADQGGKGTMVLATVKGDVHDIGKNLVDIILTNNGYTVKNLGIKVGIADMVGAVEESNADAIGMSGLLVKSTLIMRDNLEELNRRGLAHIPVILGGAALTRTYVERDLRKVYDGRLFYGKDAFEGLRTMDRLVELSRSGEHDPEFGTAIGGRDLGPRKSEQRRQAAAEALARGETLPVRSPEVAVDNPTFKPPFLGSRVAKGMALDEVAAYLNETALFRNQWGFRPEKGENDPAFKDRVRALLREQLATAKAEQLLVPQVAWGHFAANADGDDLVIFEDESRTKELTRYSFPRQTEEPWLCISDFFRPVSSGEPDWASFMVVTMGSRVSEEASRLFADDQYQQYLYLHGLGVEMAEALAEYWHRRIREELGLRRRGRAHADRSVPPEVPRRPLLVGVSGLPGTRGQRQGGGAARCRPDRGGGERGVPAPPGAVDHRHHLPPSAGQVLRGLIPLLRRRRWPVAPAARAVGAQTGPVARRRNWVR